MKRLRNSVKAIIIGICVAVVAVAGVVTGVLLSQKNKTPSDPKGEKYVLTHAQKKMLAELNQKQQNEKASSQNTFVLSDGPYYADDTGRVLSASEISYVAEDYFVAKSTSSGSGITTETIYVVDSANKTKTKKLSTLIEEAGLLPSGCYNVELSVEENNCLEIAYNIASGENVLYVCKVVKYETLNTISSTTTTTLATTTLIQVGETLVDEDGKTSIIAISFYDSYFVFKINYLDDQKIYTHYTFYNYAGGLIIDAEPFEYESKSVVFKNSFFVLIYNEKITYYHNGIVESVDGSFSDKKMYFANAGFFEYQLQDEYVKNLKYYDFASQDYTNISLQDDYNFEFVGVDTDNYFHMRGINKNDSSLKKMFYLSTSGEFILSYKITNDYETILYSSSSKIVTRYQVISTETAIDAFVDVDYSQNNSYISGDYGDYYIVNYSGWKYIYHIQNGKVFNRSYKTIKKLSNTTFLAYDSTDEFVFLDAVAQTEVVIAVDKTLYEMVGIFVVDGKNCLIVNDGQKFKIVDSSNQTVVFDGKTFQNIDGIETVAFSNAGYIKIVFDAENYLYVKNMDDAISSASTIEAEQTQTSQKQETSGIIAETTSAETQSGLTAEPQFEDTERHYYTVSHGGSTCSFFWKDGAGESYDNHDTHLYIKFEIKNGVYPTKICYVAPYNNNSDALVNIILELNGDSDKNLVVKEFYITVRDPKTPKTSKYIRGQGSDDIVNNYRKYPLSNISVSSTYDMSDAQCYLDGYVKILKFTGLTGEWTGFLENHYNLNGLDTDEDSYKAILGLVNGYNDSGAGPIYIEWFEPSVKFASEAIKSGTYSDSLEYTSSNQVTFNEYIVDYTKLDNNYYYFSQTCDVPTSKNVGGYGTITGGTYSGFNTVSSSSTTIGENATSSPTYTGLESCRLLDRDFFLENMEKKSMSNIIHCYLVYEPNGYTLKFDYNGKSPTGSGLKSNTSTFTYDGSTKAFPMPSETGTVAYYTGGTSSGGSGGGNKDNNNTTVMPLDDTKTTLVYGKSCTLYSGTINLTCDFYKFSGKVSISGATNSSNNKDWEIPSGGLDIGSFCATNDGEITIKIVWTEKPVYVQFRYWNGDEKYAFDTDCGTGENKKFASADVKENGKITLPAGIGFVLNVNGNEQTNKFSSTFTLKDGCFDKNLNTVLINKSNFVKGDDYENAKKISLINSSYKPAKEGITDWALDWYVNGSNTRTCYKSSPKIIGGRSSDNTLKAFIERYENNELSADSFTIMLYVTYEPKDYKIKKSADETVYGAVKLSGGSGDTENSNLYDQVSNGNALLLKNYTNVTNKEAEYTTEITNIETSDNKTINGKTSTTFTAKYMDTVKIVVKVNGTKFNTYDDEERAYLLYSVTISNLGYNAGTDKDGNVLYNGKTLKFTRSDTAWSLVDEDTNHYTRYCSDNNSKPEGYEPSDGYYTCYFNCYSGTHGEPDSKHYNAIGIDASESNKTQLTFYVYNLAIGKKDTTYGNDDDKTTGFSIKSKAIANQQAKDKIYISGDYGEVYDYALMETTDYETDHSASSTYHYWVNGDKKDSNNGDSENDGCYLRSGKIPNDGAYAKFTNYVLKQGIYKYKITDSSSTNYGQKNEFSGTTNDVKKHPDTEKGYLSNYGNTNLIAVRPNQSIAIASVNTDGLSSLNGSGDNAMTQYMYNLQSYLDTITIKIGGATYTITLPLTFDYTNSWLGLGSVSAKKNGSDAPTGDPAIKNLSDKVSLNSATDTLKYYMRTTATKNSVTFGSVNFIIRGAYRIAFTNRFFEIYFAQNEETNETYYFIYSLNKYKSVTDFDEWNNCDLTFTFKNFASSVTISTVDHSGSSSLSNVYYEYLSVKNYDGTKFTTNSKGSAEELSGVKIYNSTGANQYKGKDGFHSNGSEGQTTINPNEGRIYVFRPGDGYVITSLSVTVGSETISLNLKNFGELTYNAGNPNSVSIGNGFQYSVTGGVSGSGRLKTLTITNPKSKPTGVSFVGDLYSGVSFYNKYSTDTGTTQSLWETTPTTFESVYLLLTGVCENVTISITTASYYEFSFQENVVIGTFTDGSRDSSSLRTTVSRNDNGTDLRSVANNLNQLDKLAFFVGDTRLTNDDHITACALNSSDVLGYTFNDKSNTGSDLANHIYFIYGSSGTVGSSRTNIYRIIFLGTPKIVTEKGTEEEFNPATDVISVYASGSNYISVFTDPQMYMNNKGVTGRVKDDERKTIANIYTTASRIETHRGSEKKQITDPAYISYFGKTSDGSALYAYESDGTKYASSSLGADCMLTTFSIYNVSKFMQDYANLSSGTVWTTNNYKANNDVFSYKNIFLFNTVQSTINYKTGSYLKSGNSNFINANKSNAQASAEVTANDFAGADTTTKIKTYSSDGTKYQYLKWLGEDLYQLDYVSNYYESAAVSYTYYKEGTWFNDVMVSNINLRLPSAESGFNFQNVKGSPYGEVDDKELNKLSGTCSGFDTVFTYYIIPGYRLKGFQLTMQNYGTYFINLDTSLTKPKVNIQGGSAYEYKENKSYWQIISDKNDDKDIDNIGKWVAFTFKGDNNFKVTISMKLTKSDDGDFETLEIALYDKTKTALNQVMSSVNIASSDFEFYFFSEPYQYDISYDDFDINVGNGGKVTSSPTYTNGTKLQTAVYYDTLTTLNIIPTMTGYTFIGWASENYYNNETATSRYNSDTNTWNSSSIWQSPITYNTNTNLFSFANREALCGFKGGKDMPYDFYVKSNDYNGYFITDTGYSGNTIDINNDDIYSFEDNKAKSAIYKKQESYNFWFAYASLFWKKAKVRESIDSKGDIYLYAIWKANVYTLIFDVNDNYDEKEIEGTNADQKKTNLNNVKNGSTKALINYVSLDASQNVRDDDIESLSGYISAVNNTASFKYKLNKDGGLYTGLSTDTKTYYCYVAFDSANWYITTNNNVSYIELNKPDDGRGESYVGYDQNELILFDHTDVDGNMLNFVVDRYGYSWLGWFRTRVNNEKEYNNSGFAANGVYSNEDKVFSSLYANKGLMSSTETLPTLNYTNYTSFTGRYEIGTASGESTKVSKFVYYGEDKIYGADKSYLQYLDGKFFGEEDTVNDEGFCDGCYICFYHYKMGTTESSIKWLYAYDTLNNYYVQNISDPYSSGTVNYYYREAVLANFDTSVLYNAYGVDENGNKEKANYYANNLDIEYRTDPTKSTVSIYRKFSEKVQKNGSTYSLVTGNNNTIRYLKLYAGWEVNAYAVVMDWGDNSVDNTVTDTGDVNSNKDLSYSMKHNGTTRAYEYSSSSNEKSNINYYTYSTQAVGANIVRYYFDEDTLENTLNNFLPVRVGYDFVGWSYYYNPSNSAENKIDTYLRTIGTSTTTIESTNGLNNSILYDGNGNLKTNIPLYSKGDAIETYATKGEYKLNDSATAYDATNSYKEQFGDFEKLTVNGDSISVSGNDGTNTENKYDHYVYLFANWQVQTFKIGINLNIGHEQLENLYAKDSNFALALYNLDPADEDEKTLDYTSSTGINSNFYKSIYDVSVPNYPITYTQEEIVDGKTVKTETSKTVTKKYTDERYSDNVANVFFIVNFDDDLGNAKFKIGETEYTLNRLFATSAGYYFLGLLKNIDGNKDSNYVVTNTLKSFFSNNDNGVSSKAYLDKATATQKAMSRLQYDDLWEKIATNSGLNDLVSGVEKGNLEQYAKNFYPNMMNFLNQDETSATDATKDNIKALKKLVSDYTMSDYDYSFLQYIVQNGIDYDENGDEVTTTESKAIDDVVITPKNKGTDQETKQKFDYDFYKELNVSRYKNLAINSTTEFTNDNYSKLSETNNARNSSNFGYLTFDSKFYKLYPEAYTISDGDDNDNGKTDYRLYFKYNGVKYYFYYRVRDNDNQYKFLKNDMTNLYFDGYVVNFDSSGNMYTLIEGDYNQRRVFVWNSDSYTRLTNNTGTTLSYNEKVYKLYVYVFNQAIDHPITGDDISTNKGCVNSNNYSGKNFAISVFNKMDLSTNDTSVKTFTLNTIDTRLCTLYADWENKSDLTITVTNGNNGVELLDSEKSDKVYEANYELDSSSNPGLAGYYEIYNDEKNSGKSYEQTFNYLEGISGSESSNYCYIGTADTPVAKTQSQNDTGITSNFHYYDNLTLNILPYYNGRFLSSMKISYSGLYEIESDSYTRTYANAQYTLLYKFAWNAEKRIPELSTLKYSIDVGTSHDTITYTAGMDLTNGSFVIQFVKNSGRSNNVETQYYVVANAGYYNNNENANAFSLTNESNAVKKASLESLSLLNASLFTGTYPACVGVNKTTNGTSLSVLKELAYFMKVFEYFEYDGSTTATTNAKKLGYLKDEGTVNEKIWQDVNKIVLNFTNVKSSIDVECNFSVQTFDLNFYNLVDMENNQLVKKSASSNTYTSKYEITEDLDELVGENKYLSSEKADQTNLPKISQDCAEDSNSGSAESRKYNVPYGYFIYGMYYTSGFSPFRPIDETGKTGGKPNNMPNNVDIISNERYGFDYIYVHGNYYNGSSSTRKIQFVAKNNLDTDYYRGQCAGVLGSASSFPEASGIRETIYSFLDFVGWYTVSKGAKYYEFTSYDKLSEATYINKSIDLYAYYYYNNKPTSVTYYYWDTKEPSYLPYETNRDEYSLNANFESVPYEAIDDGSASLKLRVKDDVSNFVDEDNRVMIKIYQKYGVNAEQFTKDNFTTGEFASSQVSSNSSYDDKNLQTITDSYWFYEEGFVTLKTEKGYEIKYDAVGGKGFYYNDGTRDITNRDITTDANLSSFWIGTERLITTVVYSSAIKEVQLEMDEYTGTTVENVTYTTLNEPIAGADLYVVSNGNYYKLRKSDNANFRYQLKMLGSDYYYSKKNANSTGSQSNYVYSSNGVTARSITLEAVKRYYIILNNCYYPVMYEEKKDGSGSIYYDVTNAYVYLPIEDYNTGKNFTKYTFNLNLRYLEDPYVTGQRADFEYEVYSAKNDNYKLTKQIDSGHWILSSVMIARLPNPNMTYWYDNQNYGLVGYIKFTDDIFDSWRMAESETGGSQGTGSGGSSGDGDDDDDELTEEDIEMAIKTGPMFKSLYEAIVKKYNSTEYCLDETDTEHYNTELANSIQDALANYVTNIKKESLLTSFWTANSFALDDDDQYITNMKVNVPFYYSETVEYGESQSINISVTVGYEYEFDAVTANMEVNENIYAIPIYYPFKMSFDTKEPCVKMERDFRIDIDISKMDLWYFELTSEYTYVYNADKKENPDLLKFVILNEAQVEYMKNKMISDSNYDIPSIMSIMKWNNTNSNLGTEAKLPGYDSEGKRKYSVLFQEQKAKVAGQDPNYIVELWNLTFGLNGVSSGKYYVFAFYEKTGLDQDKSYIVRVSDNLISFEYVSGTGFKNLEIEDTKTLLGINQ